MKFDIHQLIVSGCNIFIRLIIFLYFSAEEEPPEMLLEAKLYGRFKDETDNDWRLIASAQERRRLECAIENDMVMLIFAEHSSFCVLDLKKIFFRWSYIVKQ